MAHFAPKSVEHIGPELVVQYDRNIHVIITAIFIGCSSKSVNVTNNYFENPYLNSVDLIFMNSTGKSDTFFITRITDDVFDTKEQVEIKEEKFKLTEVYYSEKPIDKAKSSILFSNKLNLHTNEQTLIAYWLDFWQPMYISDTLSFGTISILDKTFKNCYYFKISELEFPDASSRDIVAVYFDKEFGVVGYESRTTGVWARVVNTH